jgi:hypothetical protein
MGGKSGGKGGKGTQKGWGRLFQCCAAPAVNEFAMMHLFLDPVLWI